MRHAGTTAGAVGPLAIAVIEPAFRALLVPLARGAQTADAAGPPTREATVDVAPIAGGTQEEGLPTPAAGPHQEDLHGPAGPEMSGGGWTNAGGCATPTAGRSTPPAGWNGPGAWSLLLQAPIPSPPGSRHPTRKPPRLPLYVRLWFGFLRFLESDNTHRGNQLNLFA